MTFSGIGFGIVAALKFYTMTKIFLTFFVVAIALTGVAADKSQRSVNDCTLSFENLIAVTNSVSSLTSKEQAGLIKKASDAQNLYSIGKTADALKKLFDLQIKLDQLAATLGNPTPKISTSDEQILRTALNETISCVQGA